MTDASASAPQPSKLDQALALAARGFRVFPLIENGRTPAISGWNVRASFDADKVRAMWSAHDPVFDVTRVRDFNIGIATGRHRDGKFFIGFDVDVKNGGLGNASVEALDLVAPNEWLDTKVVETISGGRHLYFWTDVPLANTASKIAKSIDTRGEGGFLVAEGSTIDGKAYLNRGGEIRKAPAWLVQAIGAAPIAGDTGAVLCILDTTPAIERATQWLETAADIAIEGSGGEFTTLKVAARVKDFGISEQGCCELLFANWNDRCEPPWEWEALAVKVSNAYRYGKNAIGSLNPEADFDEWTQPVEKTPETPSRFTFESFAEMKTDLARRDLIKGVLLRSCTMGLIGLPGVGKSQVEAHMAYSIASGGPWCGRRVMQGAVICALGEGAEGFRGRVQAIRDAHKTTEDLPFFMSPVIPNLLDPKDVKEFVRAAKVLMASRPDVTLRLIFFDTMTTATPGGDQNATDIMSRVVSALRYVNQQLDCVAAVIHHVGKDESKGARGSSVLNGDLDTELMIEVAGQDRFTLRESKQREFEKKAPFRFVQRQAVIGQDPDGDNVTAVYCEHDESEEPADDSFADPTPARLTRQQQCLIGILTAKGEPMGRDWLRDAFVDRWTTDNPDAKPASVAANFRRITIDLVTMGLVEQSGIDRTASYRMAPAAS